MAHSSWHSKVLALLLALAGALPAAAQDRVRFDPKEHLEQYAALARSEFADLYDFGPFVADEGRQLEGARLAELRTAWVAERRRVEALLAAERADPRRWTVFVLERQLARHKYFSQLGWTRLDDVDGFVVYVQDPKRGDPGYALRVAREQVRRLAPLRRHFQEAYVAPAGIVRREDFAVEALFVLASYEDHQAYMQVAEQPAHFGTWTHYDGKLRLAVLSELPFEHRAQRAMDRAARHAYAHLLLHAHDSSPRVPLQEDWLREGLASFLAELEFSPAGRVSVPDPPAEVLQRLLAALQARATVLTHFRRIGELVSIRSYGQLHSRVLADARRWGIDPSGLDFREIYLCYWREAYLLVDYLQRGERRAGFARLLAEELTGNGGLPAFEAAYPGQRLEAHDRAFLEHLFAEHRRRLPALELSDTALEAVIAQDPSLLPEPVAAVVPEPESEPEPEPEPEPSSPADPGPRADPASAGAASAPPVPPFDPAGLAPRELAPEATLALCLELARRGRSGAAEAHLAQALAVELPADARERLQRAQAQIAAWNRLREAWFADLARRGGTYRLEHEGRTVRAAVEGCEGGVARLAQNRAATTRLVLDELDPLELVKQMGKEADELADAWARAVPYALAGDRRAARMLAGDDPLQAGLAADLAGDLPALLARGVPLAELDELSRTRPPLEPGACRSMLERLAAIVREHGALPEVAHLRPALRSYAERVLGTLFEALGPAELLRGRCQELPGGRLRLRYDFSDARQLEDFVRDDEHLWDRRMGMPATLGKRTEIRILDRALTLLGQGTLRHRLAFEAPLSVRYKLEYQDAVGLGASDIWFIGVGICDDGRGNYAAGFGLCDLDLVDGPHVEVAHATERPAVFDGIKYSLELTHDGGGTIVLDLEGRLRQQVPARSLKAGGLFFFVHSDRYVRIHDLVIEATPEAGSLAAARGAWIAERLVEHGL